MIRRVFLKCCVSAALTVGSFYGGMVLPGISLPAVPKAKSAFQEFEEIMREMTETSVLRWAGENEDDPVWKVIQNYDQVKTVIHP